MEPAESRAEHPYSEERDTPVEEIPEGFQKESLLPGGRVQITDTRLCYNWQAGPNGGCYVECGSVWLHAEQEGFLPPTETSE